MVLVLVAVPPLVFLARPPRIVSQNFPGKCKPLRTNPTPTLGFYQELEVLTHTKPPANRDSDLVSETEENILVDVVRTKPFLRVKCFGN